MKVLIDEQDLLAPLDDRIRGLELAILAKGKTEKLSITASDLEYDLRQIREKIAQRFLEAENEENDFDLLQDEVSEWALKNFGPQPIHRPVMGVSEEVGELAEAALSLLKVVAASGRLSHAQLKKEQGIRGGEEKYLAAAENAVGDIIIYLCDYCSKAKLSIAGAIQKTWNEVKQRDWRKNPVTGNLPVLP